MSDAPITRTPGISDAELLRRAVIASRLPRYQPRWAVVRSTFMVGSGNAHALCQRFGIDPDEVVRL